MDLKICPSCAGSVCNQTAQIRHGDEQTVAFPIPGLGSFINKLAHAPDRRAPGLPGGGRRLVEPVTSFSENQSGSKIAVRLVTGPGQLGIGPMSPSPIGARKVCSRYVNL